MAKYNICYSAECVTFCVYAAGFNSCNKKHTRKIANRCHKQTRILFLHQFSQLLPHAHHCKGVEVTVVEQRINGLVLLFCQLPIDLQFLFVDRVVTFCLKQNLIYRQYEVLPTPEEFEQNVCVFTFFYQIVVAEKRNLIEF